MSKLLLAELERVADVYAEARIAHDEAVVRGDIGAAVRHREHLIDAEYQFTPLAVSFSSLYAHELFEMEENMPVVWRCGSVGLSGMLIKIQYFMGAYDGLGKVVTKRGVYDEYLRNLMPLSAVVVNQFPGEANVSEQASNPHPGVIPQSNALAEASPESLNDLMSRNPFEYTQADELRVIEEMRKLRQRVLEAQGTTAFAKRSTAAKAKAPARLGRPEQAKESLGGLGL